MPIITISTYSGRTQREKDRLAEAITNDVVKIFGAKMNEVIIAINVLHYWYCPITVVVDKIRAENIPKGTVRINWLVNSIKTNVKSDHLCIA
jgi:4-oxalocrotonate tautomerase